MFDIDAPARDFAFQVITGKYPIDLLKQQSDACEARRNKVAAKELDHACPSYVHCLISRISHVGMFGGAPRLIPVCPSSVLRVLREMKYGMLSLKDLDV